MATSLPYFSILTTPSYKPKVLLKHPQVITSQSFNDEGKSRNIVDENMSILRERIRGVRKKERNEMCCKLDNGWNYKAHRYDNKHKSRRTLSEFIALVVLASSSLGLVFLSGSFCIFLVSLVVKHLYP